jgi:hypothetical protein
MTPVTRQHNIRLDEDLHTTSESQDEVKSRFLLDVYASQLMLLSNQTRKLTVIRKSPSVLELLSSENQSLLVWRNTLLVLDLGLDVVNSVRGFNLESDGLSGKARVSVAFMCPWIGMAYVLTWICQQPSTQHR